VSNNHGRTADHVPGPPVRSAGPGRSGVSNSRAAPGRSWVSNNLAGQIMGVQQSRRPGQIMGVHNRGPDPAGPGADHGCPIVAPP
jgi:hypothetical protein